MLAQFDWVGISVHSRFKLHRDEMTARPLRAMRHPLVNALNHPTGQLINRRPGYEVDLDAILRLSAATGVAIEINSQPDRLDLNDVWARRAKELGCRLVINSDAPSPGGFANLRYGVAVARRAWLSREDVPNALPLAKLIGESRRKLRKAA